MRDRIHSIGDLNAIRCPAGAQKSWRCQSSDARPSCDGIGQWGNWSEGGDGACRLSKHNDSSGRQNECQRLSRGLFNKGWICEEHFDQKGNEEIERKTQYNMHNRMMRIFQSKSWVFEKQWQLYENDPSGGSTVTTFEAAVSVGEKTRPARTFTFHIARVMKLKCTECNWKETLIYETRRQRWEITQIAREHIVKRGSRWDLSIQS
jgi:hypothetical protein